MTGYKLTDQNSKTRTGCSNEVTWEVGKAVSAKDGKLELCTDTVIHFYSDPVLAILLNPIHANIKNPRLYECKIEGDTVTDGLKSGCKKLELVKELSIPEVTLVNRIAFGILCSLEVYHDKQFTVWAENWLSGKDRTADAAANAARAVYAADAATYTVRTAAYAANAADYAANAADYAADAADAADADYAADAVDAVDAANAANAAYAAYAAYAANAANAAYAAYAANAANAAAARIDKSIDFVEVAKKAMEYK